MARSPWMRPLVHPVLTSSPWPGTARYKSCREDLQGPQVLPGSPCWAGVGHPPSALVTGSQLHSRWVRVKQKDHEEDKDRRGASGGGGV